MSHYGSVGSLYNRDYLYSPAYSMLNRSQDDSLRFETGSQCSRQGRIRRDSEGKSKFSGYGDRPGSGVEFSPFEWKGGEVLYDPKQMPRSLKPRRLYYSPIGDGVVAADGVEMKRRPKDMSPRITISHIRTSEPGEPGRPGYNLYEKHIVHGTVLLMILQLTLQYKQKISGITFKDSFGRKRCVSESSGNFDVKKDYLITNPRELIHHYATTTPVAVLDPNTDNQTNLCNVKKHYVYETEERYDLRYAPYPPYKGSSTTMHPNNFVRQLRDENLTSTQREANRCREPLNVKDEQTTRRLTQICQQTRREVSPQEIDYITEKLLCDLRTGHPTPSPL
uniref:Uncharacterized protein n=1 Tax=Syphacia muris TaxID=451379 RepID=A0A0N5A8H7_9BILA